VINEVKRRLGHGSALAAAAATANQDRLVQFNVASPEMTGSAADSQAVHGMKVEH